MTVGVNKYKVDEGKDERYMFSMFIPLESTFPCARNRNTRKFTREPQAPGRAFSGLPIFLAGPIANNTGVGFCRYERRKDDLESESFDSEIKGSSRKPISVESSLSTRPVGLLLWDAVRDYNIHIAFDTPLTRPTR